MTDMFGQRIKVGDTIAYPAVEGRLKMALSTISEVNDEEGFVRTTRKRMLRAAIKRCVVVTNLLTGDEEII